MHYKFFLISVAVVLFSHTHRVLRTALWIILLLNFLGFMISFSCSVDKYTEIYITLIDHTKFGT